MTISAGLDLDNLTKTLKLVMRELSALKRTLVTSAELRRARDYVIGQIDMSLESTDSQMMWLGEQLIGYGKTISPEGNQTTHQRSQSQRNPRRSPRFFPPERLNLALVSPLKSDKGLQKLLGASEG